MRQGAKLASAWRGGTMDPPPARSMTFESRVMQRSRACGKFSPIVRHCDLSLTKRDWIPVCAGMTVRERAGSLRFNRPACRAMPVRRISPSAGGSVWGFTSAHRRYYRRPGPLPLLRRGRADGGGGRARRGAARPHHARRCGNPVDLGRIRFFQARGRFRRLPLLRTGLIVIAAIHLGRGLIVLPLALFTEADLGRFGWVSSGDRPRLRPRLCRRYWVGY